MLELNKGEKNKIFTTLKKFLIIILVFTIICIGITVGAILNYKSNFVKKTEDKNADKITDEKDYGIKELSEKFISNNIEVKTKNYVKEAKIIDGENPYYSLEINYDQIDGLKDKNIQEKINKEIEETAISYYKQEEIDNINIKTVKINAICQASYSNVLSIFIYKDIAIKEYMSCQPIYDNSFIGLNYNLITGEKLKFEELFTQNTNIKNIIAEQAYNSLVFNKYLSDIEVDLEEVDYSIILEDEVFKILNEYNKGKNFEFSFSQNYIDIYLAGERINIPMRQYNSNIAIYKRFSDEKNIYNNRYNNAKEAYVFANYVPSYFYYTNVNEVKEYLFENIKIYVNEEMDKNRIKIILDKLIKEKENEIKEQEDYISNNKDKAIINSSIIIISYLYEDGMPNMQKILIDEQKNLYTIDKSKYDFNIILDKIQVLSENVNDVYFNIDSDSQYLSTQKTYDINTGEEIIEEQNNITENIQTNEISNEISNDISNDLEENRQIVDNEIIIEDIDNEEINTIFIN